LLSGRGGLPISGSRLRGRHGRASVRETVTCNLRHADRPCNSDGPRTWAGFTFLQTSLALAVLRRPTATNTGTEGTSHLAKARPWGGLPRPQVARPAVALRATPCRRRSSRPARDRR